MTTLQRTTAIPSRPRPAFRARRAPARRRRSRFQRHAVPALHVPAAVTARLDRRLGYYTAAIGVLLLLVLYLIQAAQVTAAGYRIEQLQAQQQDLQAEQSQLRYEEASLEAPSRVQAEASSTGMQRVAPAGYIPYRSVALNLSNPASGGPAVAEPFWARLLASVGWRSS